MQDFSRKVEEAVRNVEERIHEAAPHLNQKVAEASTRIEKEAQELIAYLNDEVVPALRGGELAGLFVKLFDSAPSGWVGNHVKGLRSGCSKNSTPM